MKELIINSGVTIQDVFIISILSIIVIITLIGQKKGWWTSKFEKLKPGDKIKVRIYATENCCCLKEAVVVKREGKLIGAVMTESEKNKCRICARENNHSKDCWYNVTAFDKWSVEYK